MDGRAEELLFGDWDKTMIRSFLQGHMGRMLTSGGDTPRSAIIDIGDFCFLAGEPDAELLGGLKGFKLLASKDDTWAALIEDFFGKRAKKIFRYAIKHEPDVFDRSILTSYVKALDANYELRMFDKEIFELARANAWSADLCSQFRDFNDYQRRAIGAAVLHEGKLVAGASPYVVYDNGIEIEIDTKPEFRRRGLATVCGAKLILECLDRGIYPSWDAHDLRSLALAEKLGYHLSHSYVTYELRDEGAR